MKVDPGAGTPVPAKDMLDISRLVQAIFDRKPDASVSDQRVKFGTSGQV